MELSELVQTKGSELARIFKVPSLQLRLDRGLALINLFSFSGIDQSIADALEHAPTGNWVLERPGHSFSNGKMILAVVGGRYLPPEEFSMAHMKQLYSPAYYDSSLLQEMLDGYKQNPQLG